jgi:hypothetical protein
MPVIEVPELIARSLNAYEVGLVLLVAGNAPEVGERCPQ